MNEKEIISKITSGDTQLVLSSACEIVSMGQEPDKIKPLVPYLNLIKEKTDGLKMGGAFAPNQRFVNAAIKTIEFHKDEKDCSCSLFGIHDCMNPRKEEEKGFLKILDTVLIDGNWVDFYTAECTRCELKFKIIERDYHYTWWGWTKINKQSTTKQTGYWAYSYNSDITAIYKLNSN